jgi:hypothetical protein
MDMDNKQKVLVNLIEPLEKIYGSVDRHQVDYYAEDFAMFDDDELKEIFVDVRRVHIGHRFPSIAEIYKVCDLRNPLAYAVSGKLYQKKASDYFYSKIEAF